MVKYAEGKYALTIAPLMKTRDPSARRPMDMSRAHVPRGEVHVIAERCKECDYCIAYCPAQVLVYSGDTNDRGYHYPEVAADKAAACVLCKFCDLICPELAIYTTAAADEEDGNQ